MPQLQDGVCGGESGNGGILSEHIFSGRAKEGRSRKQRKKTNRIIVRRRGVKYPFKVKEIVLRVARNTIAVSQSCAICRASIRSILCAECRRDVERLTAESRCRRCAVPANGDMCGQCLQKPPAFDRTYAALTFALPLTNLVRDFKFHGRWQLASLLANYLPMPFADAMLPVPLFPSREKWRGFNQSRELAHQLIRAHPDSAPPVCENAITRIFDTPPQSLMPDSAARRRNIRRAFVADADEVRGKSWLVVDDVMTSGSTLNEIARTLKAAGAVSVMNLVVGRTVTNS